MILVPPVSRVSRVAFTPVQTQRIVGSMLTDPTLPDHADLIAEAAMVERDVAALAPVLARAWPRSVARVLCLAARAGAVNRRAAALNAALAHAGVVHRVSTVTSDPSLSIVEPLWRAVLGADVRQGASP